MDVDVREGEIWVGFRTETGAHQDPGADAGEGVRTDQGGILGDAVEKRGMVLLGTDPEWGSAVDVSQDSGGRSRAEH